MKKAKNGAPKFAPFFIVLNVQIILNLQNDYLITHIRTIATLVSIINSAINPAVYAFQMPKLRVEMRKLLFFCDRN